MTSARLTRRTVLCAMPASAIVSQIALARMALAQDEEALRDQLEVSTNIAITLSNNVREARGGIEQSVALRWRELDYRGRRNFASVSVNFSQTQLRMHVREEYQSAADVLMERRVLLVPPPQDVVHLSVAQAPVGGSCPPRGEVMWDILFSSLGLLEDKHLFLQAMYAIRGTNDHFDKINRLIEGDRWEQAVDAFFDLLDFLLEGGIIAVLAQRLGDRAANKFLRAVAIRLVPFVGTGYAIAAFGLAVHRHWERLNCER